MAQVTRKQGKAGEALRRAVDALANAQGKVGWFPAAKYEDGTPVAMVAIVQEFGSTKRKIPPRPYMRVAQAAHEQEWKLTARKLAQAVALGQVPPDALMKGVTMAAEGAIRQEIAKVLTPPLSERTIAARKRRLAKGTKIKGKGIEKPLVDTGVMLNTLSSQVKKTK